MGRSGGFINRANKHSLLKYILEKKMAPHSSVLVWRIPWTEEPGGYIAYGVAGVRYNWGTK